MTKIEVKNKSDNNKIKALIISNSIITSKIDIIKKLFLN